MLRRLALALVALTLVPSCRSTGPVDPSCRDFGASAAAQKVEAFILLGDRLEADALSLSADVEAACDAMAVDLGITVPTAARGELQVEATCTAVAAEIDAILDAALPAGATLELVFEPPVCSIEVDGYAECAAECDANVTADVEVTCTEGRLVGGCSGTCMGECRIEGEVECAARCSGTCTGSCEGSCYGACEGECTERDGDGNCVGTCTGTCTGSCQGSCTGTCSGTCTADVSGSCTGSCAGSCDVDFVAPRCEGQAEVEAEVECEAVCDADLTADATCTEPTVTVWASAEVTPEAQARLDALLETLRANYPRLVSLQEKLTLVVATAVDVTAAFQDAADAAGDLGLGASACFTATVASVADSVNTVQVSFTVTVEVSASVTAEAGAGG